MITSPATCTELGKMTLESYVPHFRFSELNGRSLKKCSIGNSVHAEMVGQDGFFLTNQLTKAVSS